jgi:hypothetical protein
MIKDTRPGVKASRKFIERIAKHPDEWDLVKEIIQRISDV